MRCADLPVLVAPPVTFGVAHYKMGEPGTISLRLETFLSLLCDVARSIWKNGFHRIIFLNGHGGNIHPVGAAAVKLSEEDVWAIPLTYWQMVPDELAAWSEADAGSIGHAGEWETSLQLALRPELTDLSRAVSDMWETHFRPEVAAFARYPERRRVTATGVIGDATSGSLEKRRAPPGGAGRSVGSALPRSLCDQTTDVPRAREPLSVVFSPLFTAERTLVRQSRHGCVVIAEFRQEVRRVRAEGRRRAVAR